MENIIIHSDSRICGYFHRLSFMTFWTNGYISTQIHTNTDICLEFRSISSPFKVIWYESCQRYQHQLKCWCDDDDFAYSHITANTCLCFYSANENVCVLVSTALQLHLYIRTATQIHDCIKRIERVESGSAEHKSKFKCKYFNKRLCNNIILSGKWCVLFTASNAKCIVCEKMRVTFKELANTEI